MLPLYVYLRRKRIRVKHAVIVFALLVLLIQVILKLRNRAQHHLVKRHVVSPRTCVALFLVLHFRVPHEIFMSTSSRLNIKRKLTAYANISKDHIFIDDTITHNGLPQSMQNESFYMRGSADSDGKCGYVWGFDSQNREVLYDTCAEANLNNSWKFCKLPHNIMTKLSSENFADIDQYCKPNLAAAWPLGNISQCVADSSNDATRWVQYARSLDDDLMQDKVSNIIGHPINAWQVLGLVVEYDEDLLHGDLIINSTEASTEKMASQKVNEAVLKSGTIAPTEAGDTSVSSIISTPFVSHIITRLASSTDYAAASTPSVHLQSVSSTPTYHVTTKNEVSIVTTDASQQESYTFNEQDYLDKIRKIYPEYFDQGTKTDVLLPTANSHDHSDQDAGLSSGVEAKTKFTSQIFQPSVSVLPQLGTKDDLTTSADDSMKDLVSLQQIIYKIYGVVLDNFPQPLTSLLSNIHNATDHTHVGLPKEYYGYGASLQPDSRHISSQISKESDDHRDAVEHENTIGYSKGSTTTTHGSSVTPNQSIEEAMELLTATGKNVENLQHIFSATVHADDEFGIYSGDGSIDPLLTVDTLSTSTTILPLSDGDGSDISTDSVHAQHVPTSPQPQKSETQTENLRLQGVDIPVLSTPINFNTIALLTSNPSTESFAASLKPIQESTSYDDKVVISYNHTEDDDQISTATATVNADSTVKTATKYEDDEIPMTINSIGSVATLTSTSSAGTYMSTSGHRDVKTTLSSIMDKDAVTIFEPHLMSEDTSLKDGEHKLSSVPNISEELMPQQSDTVSAYSSSYTKEQSTTEKESSTQETKTSSENTGGTKISQPTKDPGILQSTQHSTDPLLTESTQSNDFKGHPHSTLPTISDNTIDYSSSPKDVIHKPTEQSQALTNFDTKLSSSQTVTQTIIIHDITLPNIDESTNISATVSTTASLYDTLDIIDTTSIQATDMISSTTHQIPTLSGDTLITVSSVSPGSDYIHTADDTTSGGTTIKLNIDKKESSDSWTLYSISTTVVHDSEHSAEDGFKDEEDSDSGQMPPMETVMVTAHTETGDSLPSTTENAETSGYELSSGIPGTTEDNTMPEILQEKTQPIVTDLTSSERFSTPASTSLSTSHGITEQSTNEMYSAVISASSGMHTVDKQPVTETFVTDSPTRSYAIATTMSKEFTGQTGDTSTQQGIYSMISSVPVVITPTSTNVVPPYPPTSPAIKPDRTLSVPRTDAQNVVHSTLMPAPPKITDPDIEHDSTTTLQPSEDLSTTNFEGSEMTITQIVTRSSFKPDLVTTEISSIPTGLTADGGPSPVSVTSPESKLSGTTTTVSNRNLESLGLISTTQHGRLSTLLSTSTQTSHGVPLDPVEDVISTVYVQTTASLDESTKQILHSSNAYEMSTKEKYSTTTPSFESKTSRQFAISTSGSASTTEPREAVTEITPLHSILMHTPTDIDASDQQKRTNLPPTFHYATTHTDPKSKGSVASDSEMATQSTMHFVSYTMFDQDRMSSRVSSGDVNISPVHTSTETNGFGVHVTSLVTPLKVNTTQRQEETVTLLTEEIATVTSTINPDLQEGALSAVGYATHSTTEQASSIPISSGEDENVASTVLVTDANLKATQKFSQAAPTKPLAAPTSYQTIYSNNFGGDTITERLTTQYSVETDHSITSDTSIVSDTTSEAVVTSLTAPAIPSHHTVSTLSSDYFPIKTRTTKYPDVVTEVASSIVGQLFQHTLPSIFSDAEKDSLNVNFKSTKSLHTSNGKLLTEKWLRYCKELDSLCGVPISKNPSDVSQTLTYEIYSNTTKNQSPKTMILHTSVYPTRYDKQADYLITTVLDIKRDTPITDDDMYLQYPVTFVMKLSSYLSSVYTAVRPISIRIHDFRVVPKRRRRRSTHSTVEVDWTINDKDFVQFNESYKHLILVNGTAMTNYDFFVAMLPEMIVSGTNISSFTASKSSIVHEPPSLLAQATSQGLSRVLPPVLIGLFGLASCCALIVIRCRKRPTFFFVSQYIDRTYEKRKPILIDDDVELDHFRPAKAKIIDETSHKSKKSKPKRHVSSHDNRSLSDHDVSSVGDEEDGSYSFRHFSFAINNHIL